MAKSKGELEADCQRYYQLLSESRAAQNSGDNFRALECAAKCLDYVDGMMRFERRYEDKSFRSIPAIDFLLNQAPLYLGKRFLDGVETLLASQRLVEKHTTLDIAGKLAEARSALNNAHLLWNHLENNPDFRQDELEQTLGWSQEQWRRLCLRWAELGVVYREIEGVSYRLRLRDPLGEPTTGKCPACGQETTRPKHELLEPVTCIQCKEHVTAVLLSDCQSIRV